MAPPNARRNTAWAATLFYVLSIPLLILVLIGNTYKNSTLTDIYFFKLDVSHIIPVAGGNAHLLNSLARSLGLHDFYQVGVWNFCEGYIDEGVTYCSKPKQWYWFNPVETLVSELIEGAQIPLPNEAITVLEILKIGSKIMYAFFLAGICVNFVLIFVTPLVIRTRWWSLAFSFLSGIAGILVTVGAIIATVISIAFKVALTAQDQLDITVDIGVKMFIFMWLAAVFTDVAFLLHAAMGCCCRPQQRHAASPVAEEKRTSLNLPNFVRRRTSAAVAAATQQRSS